MNFIINTTVEIEVDDVMDSLSKFDKVDFVCECYDYMSNDYQNFFLEELGATEVVERLGEDNIVKELESRGYKITKDGSEDI